MKPLQNITTGTTNRSALTVIQELQRNNYDINIIYDIGANKGLWTRLWKSHLPFSTFIMFEGNPVHKVNVQGNDKFFNGCVLSDEAGKKLKYYIPNDPSISDTGCGYYQELTPHFSECKFIPVETTTLDSMVVDYNLPTPDFIKMDVQGAEVDIIKGGAKTVSKAKVVMLEMPIMWYNDEAPVFSDYIDAMYLAGFIPSGVDHVAIKMGVFNQMDVVFVRKDIVSKIHNYTKRYTGF